MKLVAAALATAAVALTFSGCVLVEAERPNIWLQNNSDQTVTLQMVTRDGPLLPVVAKPHTTQKSSGSPPKNDCLTDWEVVDASGKVLKKIAKVCANDTVVYP